MKSTKIVLLALAAGLAGGAAHAGLITCWYNAQQQFTGADGAEPGVVAGGPARTQPPPANADYTWAYTIVADDGRACPRTMPPPTRP